MAGELSDRALVRAVDIGRDQRGTRLVQVDHIEKDRTTDVIEQVARTVVGSTHRCQGDSHRFVDGIHQGLGEPCVGLHTGWAL